MSEQVSSATETRVWLTHGSSFKPLSHRQLLHASQSGHEANNIWWTRSTSLFLSLSNIILVLNILKLCPGVCFRIPHLVVIICTITFSPKTQSMSFMLPFIACHVSYYARSDLITTRHAVNTTRWPLPCKRSLFQ